MPQNVTHLLSVPAHPDLCLHNRQHPHASFLACDHWPLLLQLLLLAEACCCQGDQRGEEVLQSSSVALQLAPLNCHPAPAVQDAVAEGGFDGEISYFTSRPTQGNQGVANCLQHACAVTDC